MVIAIDGPAGAGKSTIAKLVAEKLGFVYVDTGAMYRALTLKALRSGCDTHNAKALVELASTTEITFRRDGSGRSTVYLDGCDVSREIRDPKVTKAVFLLARIPQIRTIMVDRQRNLGRQNSIVMEGRDIGTVVFPRANKKFYVDATPQVRAQRRMRELQGKNINVTFAQVMDEIKDRDLKDKTRKCGPLKIAGDAVYVDTTKLTIQQVVDTLLRYIDDERE